MNNSVKQQQFDLEPLKVFERLEVGPIKLERRRLTAPYRLFLQGKVDEFKLIYSYEEAVFQPEEPESRNLAGLIAAQPALNYGLFCNEIVFHGLFDEIDRRLLRDMAENTAREIYVNKFLKPNPFLRGPASRLIPQKHAKYMQAVFKFRNPHKGDGGISWQRWSTITDRHCMLSSGGKDSLLTHGLLDEIRVENHPIFVNESGRHWFTALNAYRYFRNNIPHTARVWVNSDRLFSWMLKRMPFIRSDFANLRSDEYPIRLWTVAVFLFGVLPLVRKRGMGRLLVGDEFDTSARKTFNGILHYDGLYDQSIWFDQALSRFFMRKGWAVSQFSVLRPLSELLIEKILAVRYPQLQANQISCHAAHKEADRIVPCGKCEKCRRIISMLSALDVDPGGCGYRKDQISAALMRFAKMGLSQEAVGVRQLGHMLLKKNLIQLPEDDRASFGPQPEVLNLRFDPQISPLNAIPMDLRAPLLKIFIQYANGALQRVGKKWMPVDPFADKGLDQPYAFELAINGQNGPADKRAAGFNHRDFIWGELTWPEAKHRFQEVDIALLPVGAVEQHGPHLPLDTDAFDAKYLDQRVADACSDPKPLVLPCISYGVSYHHEAFAGTVSISNDALSKLV